MSDSPTWYDVLGVPRDASSDEVRAAWRVRTDDLTVDDQMLTALNRAVKVLLNPESRVVYDESLPSEVHDEHDIEVGRWPLVQDERQARRETTVDDESGFAAGASAPSATSEGRTVPGWLLVGLGLLAAGLVAATVWMWVSGGDGGDDSAAREAQVAAERAVVPVLSYDYETLDEDQRAAQALMTGSYRQEYDKLFAVLKENAPETQTTVTASVVASGIVRATDDRVQVLVFVDRPTTNKLSAEPVVYKDQVTLSMQLVDGTWLVDDMITSPVQG